MLAEPGWCGVCGLPVAAGERFCRWPLGAGAGDGQYDGEVVPGASHSLAFMTELVELQHWHCPWCRDYLPDSPRGTAIDHIIPRVYGGPHRRWNLQLLHQECNSAKGKKITAEALELADAHGVTISMDIGQYRAGVRRRAATYAVRATRQLGADARNRALAAARDLTVFFPEAEVRAVIRTAAHSSLNRAAVPCPAAEDSRPASSCAEVSHRG
jgi:HNH endonuclease